MINAEEFKKQMREISTMDYPCGPLCTGCGMFLNAKIGTIDFAGRLDTTACLKVLANYLDREWKKQEMQPHESIGSLRSHRTAERTSPRARVPRKRLPSCPPDFKRPGSRCIFQK